MLLVISMLAGYLLGMENQPEETHVQNHKLLRKIAIAAGALFAIGAIFVMQRDYIYGAKGNMGQGTHARF